MDIKIQRGEGISQAIKRQLKAEGASDAQFKGSVWAKIQQALNDNASTLKHGDSEQKIGELWTTLNMNVRTQVNDTVAISEETWNKIKGFLGQTSDTPAPKANNSGESGTKPAQKPAETKDTQKPVQNPQQQNVNETKDAAAIRLSIKGDQEATEQLHGANDFVAKVANMNPKPNVVSGRNNSNNYNFCNTKLDDGRWIEYRQYDDGDIYIMINHDTTHINRADGSTVDGSDVAYLIKPDGTITVYIDKDKNNDKWEIENRKVNAPERRDNMLKLMDKIFGEKLPKKDNSYKTKLYEKDNAAKAIRQTLKSDEKATQQLNAAADLLTGAANGTIKVTQDSSINGMTTLIYGDKRIVINKKSSKEITVSVSTDPTKDNGGRGSDKPEVIYHISLPDKTVTIDIDTDKSNNEYELKGLKTPANLGEALIAISKQVIEKSESRYNKTMLDNL